MLERRYQYVMFHPKINGVVHYDHIFVKRVYHWANASLSQTATVNNPEISPVGTYGLKELIGLNQSPRVFERNEKLWIPIIGYTAQGNGTITNDDWAISRSWYKNGVLMQNIIAPFTWHPITHRLNNNLTVVDDFSNPTVINDSLSGLFSYIPFVSSSYAFQYLDPFAFQPRTYMYFVEPTESYIQSLGLTDFWLDPENEEYKGTGVAAAGTGSSGGGSTNTADGWVGGGGLGSFFIYGPKKKEKKEEKEPDKREKPVVHMIGDSFPWLLFVLIAIATKKGSK